MRRQPLVLSLVLAFVTLVLTRAADGQARDELFDQEQVVFQQGPCVDDMKTGGASAAVPAARIAPEC